jgi:hypothetical protein
MSTFLRPDGDITTTGVSSGTFADIDETTASDADFILGGENTAVTYECSLTNPSGTPGAGTTTVRYRAAKFRVGALATGGNTLTLTVSVYQGATLIATDPTTRTLDGAWNDYSWTPDMSSVTDWNDLRLRFVSPASAGNATNRRALAVSWTELQAPAVPAGFTLTADTVSFALTGHDAGLVVARRLTADTSSFALTGHDAELLADRTLTADTATFALTGSDADLSHTPVGSTGAGGVWLSRPRVGPIDLKDPIEWDHPPNQGLRLALVGVPGLTGGGRWPDLTGRSAGGTLVNGPTWAVGNRGVGVRFDAGISSRYVEVPDADHLDVTTEGTVSAWVRIDSLPATNAVQIVAAKGGNYILRFANSSGETDGVPALSAIYFDGTNVRRRPFPNSSTGEFHVAMVISGNDIVGTYINGVESGGTTSTWFGSSRTLTSPLTIGGVPGNEGFDGIIYDVSYYGRALSAAEIATLCREPHSLDRDPRFRRPPALSWFYGSSGATALSLIANTGSFALTGHDVGLSIGRTLTADTGTFALTGNDAGLLLGRRLTADTGSYTLTGHDAGLLAARTLTADAASYTLTGHDAELVYTPAGAFTLTADVGTFSLTGHDAGLTVSRLLTADTATYTLTGHDAELIYTPVGAFTLTVDTGTFALTGHPAGLTVARTLTADTGTFTLTGHDANLVYTPAGSLLLTADTGSFTLTGHDAGLRVTRRLVADTAAYTLTGQAANLVYSRRLVADIGSFVLTGHSAGLTADRRLAASLGEFTLTGNDAGLSTGFAIQANAGAFALTGHAATFATTRILGADAATFALTGNAAGLLYSEAPTEGFRINGRIGVNGRFGGTIGGGGQIGGTIGSP